MGDFVDRRTVLRSGAVATALGLAGCLSRLPGDDSTPDGNQSDDDPEPDDDGEERPSAVESWPSFQYDAGNSGHAEGRGPRGDLTEAWSFEREGKMRGGPVISEDGVVYIGSDEGTMYALDLEDGSLLWSTDTGNRLRRVPVIYEELVIYATGDGLFALDRHSGELAWDFPALENRGVATTPVVADDTLVVGGGAMNVFGIEAASGNELWKAELESDSDGPAAIANGEAYVFDWTNEVHAFDLETGQHTYSASIDEGQITGATVADEVIYAGGRQGRIYALDASNLGTELWRCDLGAVPDQSPAVSSDQVFVRGIDGTITAVNRESGDEEWSNEVDSWAVSAPAVVGETVYTGGYFGAIYGFRTDGGGVSVQQRISSEAIHHPTIVDGLIVVGSSGGTVYAIEEI